eukprot:13179618-Ditylum_brightwellii.AAC.1
MDTLVGQSPQKQGFYGEEEDMSNTVIQEETTLHYSDNLNLVRRMNWAEKKPNTTPGECSVADTDVQQQ